jgi:tagatose 1,6-diphosphate aldolase
MRTDQMPIPPPLGHAGVTLRLETLFPGDKARGLVPSYHFRIINEDGKDVGHLNFRIEDTPHIIHFAGHIGYAVRPQFRGHRYALRACQAVAPFVAQLRGSVIITADTDNLPSLRTIERLGCEDLGESPDPQEVPRISRGCRQKRRYRWTPEVQ